NVSAFRHIDWNNHQQIFTDVLMEDLAKEYSEPEIIELIKEERSPPVTPCEPILHEEIKRLCDTDNAMMNLTQYPHVFRYLSYAFMDITFLNDCQANNWQENFWISTEFQRLIATKGESLNPFLRPPRWIIIYRNQQLIFLSALEANWVIGRLNSLYHKRESKNPSMTTLRLLLPHIKRVQSIFVNTPSLTIPPLIGYPNDTICFFTSPEWLVQLFIFNGTLYFETVDEQIAYCQCLSLCPKPRTMEEEEEFKNGWMIAVDGFVSNPEHRHCLKTHQVRFHCNLLTFVKNIIENRYNSHAPMTSYVGSIILNTFKLI
ncbi:unnamed protein product, partial [Rotaria sp. Silwood1]